LDKETKASFDIINHPINMLKVLGLWSEPIEKKKSKLTFVLIQTIFSAIIT
jgi:hypothetical protein